MNVYEGVYDCPVCGGKETVPEGPGCSKCGYEYDAVQYDNHDYDGGRNWLSVNQAKANYEKTGSVWTESDEKAYKEFYR